MARQAPPARGTGAAAAPADTDRSAAEMVRLQQRRAQKLTEKRVLERTYEAQLRELDRLKRSKPSWRRDRQIRSSQAESQSTADRLSALDLDLRTIDGLLRRQRQALLAAIDRELALHPESTRRALLDRMRARESAALEPRARKILVPDDTLDELADPQELTEQIALIQQAEVELRREREALHQREERYARMARLRDVRQRAGEMSELDEDVVRRGGGRAGGRASTVADPEGTDASSNQPSPQPPSGGSDDGAADLTGGGGQAGGNGGGPGPGGGVDEDGSFEQSSILLTDVVDSSTIDALRRAGRSSSAKARAEAAARARKQVEARLEQLERGRVRIERHLTRLRQGR